MGVIEQTKNDARWLIYLMLLIGVLAAFLLLMKIPTTQIAIVFSLIPLLIATIILATLILLKGPSPQPIGLLLSGLLFMVGGTAFDVIATLIHDPNLIREGNPIVRLFLDSGLSTGFVFWFGAAGQILYILLSCLLWAGFLSHAPEVVRAALATNPPNTMAFIKAAFGADHLTWLQWFFPLKLSHLPKAYGTLWMTVVFLVGSFLARWFFGLQWYGFARSVNLFYIVLLGTFLAGCLYIYWLVREYQKVPV